MEVPKEGMMHTQEYGTQKQEPKEEIKEGKARGSKESGTPVEKRDIALGSAERRDRKEERREEEKDKDSKEHVIYVESLDIAQATAGTQEKAKEVKEEHMSWNGRKSQKRGKEKRKMHSAWKRLAHGEDRS